MSEYGEIFQTTIPGVKKRATRVVESPAAQKPEQTPAKAKRKYTRKTAPVIETVKSTEVANVSPELCDRAEEMSRVPEKFAFGNVPGIPERPSFSSCGLEYLGALERLLALIGEPQRTRLVDFIVDNNIV